MRKTKRCKARIIKKLQVGKEYALVQGRCVDIEYRDDGIWIPFEDKDDVKVFPHEIDILES